MSEKKTDGIIDRWKRNAKLTGIAALAIQVFAANKFDYNIAGEVISAWAGDRHGEQSVSFNSGSGGESGSNYQFSGNAQAANKYWQLNPNYAQVIDALPIEAHKKQYLKFVAEGVAQVVNAGYAINPQVMFVQAPWETGYGTDSIARNNNEHFGAKGGGSVHATTEYVDGKYVSTIDSFQSHDPNDSYASFFNYAEVITNRRADIYGDTACGITDAELYLEALVSRLDNGCKIAARQGEIDPATGYITQSYATGPNYVSGLMNMIEFTHADEIWLRVG